MNVWVNFGGIFSYNFVHCLLGLVPFNDFCLGWCPLFSRYFYIPAGAGFLPSTVATAKEKGVPLKMHFPLKNDEF